MLAVSLEARWEVGRQVYGDENFLELELSEHRHGPAAGRLRHKGTRKCPELEPGYGDLGKGLRGAENGDAEKETTLFFLPSLEQGLLCPQEPPGTLSLERGAGTQGEVACLGLGCDRKQEVPVISQEGLTVRERASENWQTPKVG